MATVGLSRGLMSFYEHVLTRKDGALQDNPLGLMVCEGAWY